MPTVGRIQTGSKARAISRCPRRDVACKAKCTSELGLFTNSVMTRVWYKWLITV